MRTQAKIIPQMKSCLVIEDNLFDQKLIERTAFNARVDAILEFATSIKAARHALATRNFSVVLCDNNLPDGNGSDFAKELADDPDHVGTSIFIVSGWPSPFMWAKARAAGLHVIDKNEQLQAKLRSIFKKYLCADQGPGGTGLLYRPPNPLL